jgi:hypothetical protein
VPAPDSKLNLAVAAFSLLSGWDGFVILSSN